MPTIIELCKAKLFKLLNMTMKDQPAHTLHSFHEQNSPFYLLPANTHENGCQKNCLLETICLFHFFVHVLLFGA